MAADPNSILESVKKALGLEPEIDVFDLDVIMHINSTFSTLTQLGVGPTEGFLIEDGSAVWDDFIPAADKAKLNSVQSYMYTCVRLLFDPPPTSFGLDAANKVKEELGWRLNVASEELHPPAPLPDPVLPDPEGIAQNG